MGGSLAQAVGLLVIISLTAEPTKAKERSGKLIHFAEEVGWARASEGAKE